MKKKPDATVPELFCIDLTYRCPSSCSFCFLRRSGLLNSGVKELPLAAWKKMLDRLPAGRRFYITGGEPLLRPDAVRLVELLKARGFGVCVTTNGLFLDSTKLAALLACGADTVAMSLHRAWETRDGAFVVPGAFLKARRLAAVFAGLREKVNTRFELWTTVNPDNYMHLSRLVESMAELGADAININHFEYITEVDATVTGELLSDAGLDCSRLSRSAVPAPDIDMGVLKAEIRRIKAMKIPGLRFSPDLSPSGLERWYGGGNCLPRKGRCLGQTDSIWLSPDGEILSCQPLSVSLGRMGKDGSLDDFRGKKYEAFRGLLEREGGYLPACSRCGRISHIS